MSVHLSSPEQRREAASVLYRANFPYWAIGKALGVSHETARKDVWAAQNDQLQSERHTHQQRAENGEVSPEEALLLEQLRSGQTVVLHKDLHPNAVVWAQEAGVEVLIDGPRWGNPFKLGLDGDHEEIISKYRDHYLPHKTSLTRDIGQLKGKALVCSYAPWPCHGDVLAELADRCQ